MKDNKPYIDCPSGRQIEIAYANYGRLKGAHVCGLLIPLNTNCRADSSMVTVEGDCKDQNGCLLEATNAKFGGDPCPLTKKYLEVSDVELVYFVRRPSLGACNSHVSAFLQTGLVQLRSA